MRKTCLAIAGVAAMVGTTAIQAEEVSFQSFAEENDLWMEDNIDNKSNNMTEQLFNQIIDAGINSYQEFADEKNETLTINKNWSDSTVNANCSRFFGSVTINMYGGLARRDEVTPEGFALVLCHELSHAYGGTPYINSWMQMSAEGQADYMGAKVCLQKVLPQVDIEWNFENDFAEESCAAVYNDRDEYELCVRNMSGSHSLGHLLSVMKEEPIPAFDTPDPTEVPSTITSYPETIQCRLDTYFNGVLGNTRPACWFKN